ncbi:MAG: long-chain fatty acid transport protein [Oleiphilaceae bacterium]|jgi:long-chain fatty acid transport protein
MFRILLLNLCVFSSAVYAGGFDSSGRPFEIIFGDDNALEMSMSYLKPYVTLDVSRNIGDGTSLPGTAIDRIVGEYSEPRFAIRLKVNDQVNCASQIERPFRFKTTYKDDVLSYQSDSNQASSQVAAPINSEYSSESISFACSISYRITHDSDIFKHSFFSIIAGPKLQRIEGSFSSDLTNQTLGSRDNYIATLDGSSKWGYLIGLAYEIPEVAFRASIFFHNEIHHDLSGKVEAPLPDFSNVISQTAESKTLTPKAVNFRLQSGIAEDWLAFMELRWGDWSSLDEMQVEAGDLSGGLVLFKNDTLNYKIGLGVKMTERLSLGGYFESIVDLNPPVTPKGIDGTNLRNPQADRYSLAFGGKYLLVKSLSLALGGSYYYIENGRFSDKSYTVNLDSSKAIAFSGTITYLF